MGGTSRSRLSGAPGHPKTSFDFSRDVLHLDVCYGRASAGRRFDLVPDAFSHEPVLLQESVTRLQLAPGALVVDATVGGGGHAEAILERTAPDGVLLGLDCDDEALAAAAERLNRFGARVRLVRASFGELRRVLAEEGIEKVDAVLFDLGVSSRQLDTPARGFRFAEDEAAETPLDMRMDRRRGRTAAELLAQASQAELEHWFRSYGELPGAARLARAIVERRERAPLRTSADLLAAVREARVGRGRRHHPATLVFQALRIAVNDELSAIEAGLEAAIDALRPGGRLVVIAYHSLEDRLVKQTMRTAERGCVCPPRVPVCVCGRKPRLRCFERRSVTAGEEELHHNPRSRSARLRVAERIEDRT
jgi:16S rRNA (cytosine1402-N4)-methyltransferase